MIAKTTECEACNQTMSDSCSVDAKCDCCLTLQFVEELQSTIDQFIPLGSPADVCCLACEGELLREGSMLDEDVLYCRTCRGLLIENDAIHRIVSGKPEQSPVSNADSRTIPVNRIELQRNICCPGCESRMDVHPHLGADSIVIDSCTECGMVWLDHGEMARIGRTTSPGR